MDATWLNREFNSQATEHAYRQVRGVENAHSLAGQIAHNALNTLLDPAKPWSGTRVEFEKSLLRTIEDESDWTLLNHYQQSKLHPPRDERFLWRLYTNRDAVPVRWRIRTRFPGIVRRDQEEDVDGVVWLTVDQRPPIRTGKFSSWLITVTDRACLTFIRTWGEDTLPLNDGADDTLPLEETISSANSPEYDVIELVLLSEEWETVFQEAHLTEEERNVLQWRYVEDLSYEEIAEIHQLEVYTAERADHRAMQKIRRALEIRSAKGKPCGYFAEGADWNRVATFLHKRLAGDPTPLMILLKQRLGAETTLPSAKNLREKFNGWISGADLALIFQSALPCLSEFSAPPYRPSPLLSKLLDPIDASRKKAVIEAQQRIAKKNALCLHNRDVLDRVLEALKTGLS